MAIQESCPQTSTADKCFSSWQRDAVDSSNSYQQLIRFVLSCNWEAFPASFIHMALHMRSLSMVLGGRKDFNYSRLDPEPSWDHASCVHTRAGPSQDLLGRFRWRLEWLAPWQVWQWNP